MTDESPRIALLGFNLESNRYAPVAGRRDFENDLHLLGQDMLDDAYAEYPKVQHTLPGFVKTMDATGPWTPVPVLITSAGASGPADHGFFVHVEAEMRRRLKAAAPLDGVYFSEHGAAITTEDTDPDGALFAMAREVVGPRIPVVATLDLHANISERMVDSTDILIAYRTNPHVDQYDRGVEAARAMRELLAGVRTEKAFIRLPLAPPNVTQRTDSGPYAEIIDIGQTRIDDVIMNVSILSGFVQGDTPKNGMAFIVTAREDKTAARALCRELAERTWVDRHRFVPRLTSLTDCVKLAVDLGEHPEKPSVIIADVADNPGSGARGNTTGLLEALHQAGAKGVILSTFNDPPLAAEAHVHVVGATFHAVFNRDEPSPYSRCFEADATVLDLSQGTIVGHEGGAGAGRTLELGPTAALQVGEIKVVVTSNRRQCLDPGHFDNFGISVADSRTVIVKSRGHFRAGFAHLFPPERIVEADLPGLSSPNLSFYDFERLPRPIFPLDSDTTWQPPDW
jgi:microcystin degradation protein MlrC